MAQRFLLFAVFLVVLASVPTSSQTVIFYRPSIGAVLRFQAADAFRNFQATNAGLADASRAVELARARYWKLFPSAPGFKEAEAEFARLLFGKDMWYITMEMVPKGGAIQALSPFLVKPDGGIRPLAQRAFDSWMGATRTQVRAPEFGLPGGGSVEFRTFLDAFVANPILNEYRETYLRLRDLAEFEASGIDLTRVIDARSYATLQIEETLLDESIDGWQAKYLIGDGGQRAYTNLARVLGNSMLDQAAMRVLAAPRDRDGNLRTPVTVATTESGKTIQTNTTAGYFQVLLAQNTKAYAVMSLLGGPVAYASEGLKNYQDAVSACGESRVIAAAERAKTAPARGDLDHIGPFYWQVNRFKVIGLLRDVSNPCIASDTPKKVDAEDVVSEGAFDLSRAVDLQAFMMKLNPTRKRYMVTITGTVSKIEDDEGNYSLYFAETPLVRVTLCCGPGPNKFDAVFGGRGVPKLLHQKVAIRLHDDIGLDRDDYKDSIVFLTSELDAVKVR